MADLLIVDDDEMPILNGPEMAQSLFVQEMSKENTPILLCSGVLDLQHIAEEVGTPYFLAKPFGLDEFLQLLERALVECTAPSPGPRARDS